MVLKFFIDADPGSIKLIKRNLMMLVKHVDKAAAQALNVMGEDIARQAKQRAPLYVGPPRKGIIRGFLRRSIFVIHTQDAKRNEMQVVAGAVYARHQHEGNFRHEVGMRNYLAGPFFESMSKFAPIMNTYVAAALRDWNKLNMVRAK